MCFSESWDFSLLSFGGIELEHIKKATFPDSDQQLRQLGLDMVEKMSMVFKIPIDYEQASDQLLCVALFKEHLGPPDLWKQVEIFCDVLGNIEKVEGIIVVLLLEKTLTLFQTDDT